MGPFKTSAWVGKVTYWLNFPDELGRIPNTFHVSQLWKCVANDSAVIYLDDIQVNERLNYVEMSIAILNRKTKALGKKMVNPVTVQW